MQVGDLVKVRRYSGILSPTKGVIVEIKKDEFNCVLVVHSMKTGLLMYSNPNDVEVISAL
jgi:hypothetical protein